MGIIRSQDSDPNAPGESPRLFGRPASRVGARDGGSLSVKAWPCWAPPWGRLTAINVNTGDIAWQIPFGTMEGVPCRGQDWWFQPGRWPNDDGWRSHVHWSCAGQHVPRLRHKDGGRIVERENGGGGSRQSYFLYGQGW